MRFIAFLSLFFAFSFNVHAQRIDSGYFDGQLYIKLKDEIKLPLFDKSGLIQNADFLKEFENKYGVEKIRASFFFSKNPQLRNTLRIYFSEADEIQSFIKDLSSLPQIEYVEPVPLHRTTLTPNDLGGNSTNGTGQWSLWKINAQAAWDITVGNSAVVVAVVDDAVQITHPDLQNVCLPGRDVSDQDNDPNPPDNTFDHGTHVAGIIGAQTNNGTGVASIGFGVSILPVKSTNQAEFITDGYEGLVWAIENGADVVNMSWGGSGFSQTGQNIMDIGYNQNVVLVAASGNDDVSDLFYPAAFDHVITVASTSSSDAKSGFSNYGAWIDISAPGSSIRSTVPTSSYDFKSGTSMASPLVAGLCGLMLSANSLLTPDEILDCLQQSADNIDANNPNYIGQLGAGRINAEAAVACANVSALAFDASVFSIVSPVASTCETSVIPEIIIRNNGQNLINSVQVNISLDGIQVGTFTWNGNLNSQQSIQISLPAFNATIGDHILEICSSQLNGNVQDVFISNNCKSVNFSVIPPNGGILPFSETFESGSFATNGWTVVNPDNQDGWELVSTGGNTPGAVSASIPFYVYSNVGQRDGLITPAFDFTAYENIQMDFDHAYRRYEQGYTDSLIVSVSTDCGITFPHRIYLGGENGTGSFATQSISTQYFTPAVADDWCGGSIGSACVSLDLNQFSGMSGVRIKFEGYNNFGNNLYLDNINITGDLLGLPPVASFAASGSTTICAGEFVLFQNTSTNEPGNFSWNFNGGSPASSQDENPEITYNIPGIYQVSLTVQNQFGSDTEQISNYIIVNEIPPLNVSVQPPAVCLGQSAEITASGATNYSWSPQSILSSASGSVVQATPDETSTLTLSGTNANGCTNSFQFVIQVYDIPQIPEAIQTGVNELTAPDAFAYQWYFEGNPIEGGTFQTYSPSQSGNYSVEVFNQNGCSSISEEVNFDDNVLDLSAISSDPISIYPNPARDYIYISKLGVKNQYSLFSSDGKLISEGNLQANSLFVGDFEGGIYHLLISGNSGQTHLRFVLIK
ncbi:MAG: S8 family serine peptidase [Bacteroidia bacterium]